MKPSDAVRAFIDARDWQRYHTPKNLALAIASEAGELAHLYRWTEMADQERATDELADVLIFCLSMANALGVDPEEIVRRKLAKNEDRPTDGPDFALYHRRS